MMKTEMNIMSEGKRMFSRVCHPFGSYTLLQYLLISSEEEIADTFFFFMRGWISDSVIEKFPNRFASSYVTRSKFMKIFGLVWWKLMTIFKNHRWPFLKNAEMFMDDHTHFGYLLGRDHIYTLLEDGLALYQIPLPSLDLLHRMFLWPIFHPFPVGKCGQNERCQAVVLTKTLPEGSPLREKKVISLNFSSIWESASPQKRNFICSVFGVSESDIQAVENADVVLTTQCLSEDGLCSEQEKIDGYRRMLSDYGCRGTIVVKRHPREKTDYNEALIGYDIRQISADCPMELFILLCSRIKRLMTSYSTAVMSFPRKEKIVWAGTGYFPSVHRLLGDRGMPE